MAYDIYGNQLRRGYCEVHPNVHEEYPCSACTAESSVNEAERYAQQAYQEGQINGYAQGYEDGYAKATNEAKE